MSDLLVRLKTLLRSPYVQTDGAVFRLHWCFTSSILMVFSLFILVKQYLDKPISCMSNSIDRSTLNEYCMLHSTYTITPIRSDTSEVAHPGVDITRDEAGWRNVSHFQWVGFFLLFQAIMFYLPRVFWNNIEAGKIRSLVKDLDTGLGEEGKRKIVDYLYDNINTHDKWAYWYFFCELLTLLHIILQILLTNKFLDFAFLTFGSGQQVHANTWWSQEEEDMTRSLLFSLPSISRCIFHKFGSSGELEKIDTLCLLPVNMFSEKIFLFLWFWFFFLALLTTCLLVTRVVVMLAPQVRTRLLHISAGEVKDSLVETVWRNTRVGDWVLLELLANNMENNTFKEVLEGLATELENRHKEGDLE